MLPTIWNSYKKVAARLSRGILREACWTLLPKTPVQYQHSLAALPKANLSQDYDRAFPLFNYDKAFQNVTSTMKQNGNYRIFGTFTTLPLKFPSVLMHQQDGTSREVVIWGTTRIFNMAQHPKLREASKKAVDDWGTGSGGSRNINGTHTCHTALEQEIAAYMQKEAGLVFSSGYTTNEAALSVLGSKLPNCVIFSASENHSSMISGIRMSNAEVKIFPSFRLDKLETLLRQQPFNRPKIIAFESVYSMSGGVTDIAEIVRIAKTYNALTYIDEAHSFGMYGATGAGMTEAQGMLDGVDFIMGSFSKAGGSYGGFITGDHEGIDVIRSCGKQFIFTGSLPPSITQASRAALAVLQSSPWLRQALKRQVRKLRDSLRNAEIEFYDNDSHVTPVIIPGAQRCKRVTDLLLEEYGILLQPMNFPTVPVGTERLRVTATPFHTDEMIDNFVMALKTVLQDV